MTDNLVYTTDADGNLKALGELGKSVDVNDIYKNLLEENSKEADDIWYPRVFREKVKYGGDWDYKSNKKSIFGLANMEVDGKDGNGITQFNFQGQVLEAQDIGNHHYGVVGRAMGIPENILFKKAGEAQINQGTSKDEWQVYKTTFVPGSYVQGIPGSYVKELVAPYGDDPRDQGWIKKGFEYYNKNIPDGDWW
jgi:hypothetical protein